MARFDLYAMPGRGAKGYVLDVQADLLSHLATRTVVPLLPADKAPPPIRGLNPIFTISGQPHVMLTQAIAAMPRKEMGRPIIGLDGTDYDSASHALDILLTGF